MISSFDLDRSQWAVGSPLHNKLAEQDRPIHAWYRFVLSFPPHLVRDYLTRFSVQPGDVVLDPFCGTGTTLVECKKHAISGVGYEANALAALATRVKCNWNLSPEEVSYSARWVAEKANEEIAGTLPEIGSERVPAICERTSLFDLKSLDSDAEELLLKGSISPKPLHRSLVLLRRINSAPLELVDLFKVALAWTLVSVAGNIRFGPEVGITKPKDDEDVVGAWLQQCERMAADLLLYSDRKNIPTMLTNGDSRDVSHLEDQSISAVFTSPPYPNEKDYTRTTRLESVVLGLIRNKRELRQMKEGLLRSNTRNVYMHDEDHKWVEHIPEVEEIAREIERRRIDLGKTSGFEKQYHRVARLYFGGMARHLESLQPKLKSGAKLGYVVGDQASFLQVHIPTGEILGKIAQELGYELESIDLFRTRLATATRQQLREEVVVLRWPG
mgnify:CR=1 FL=1